MTSRPLWDGSEVDRLFIWSEQGVGDEVMFASCFNELVHRCEQLIVACENRLIPIFQRSFGSKFNLSTGNQNYLISILTLMRQC